MKNLKLVLLLFFLSGIISCKKLSYEKTSVTVTVFDTPTQQYLPNIKITLYELKNETPWGPNPSYSMRVLKEAYTDPNGQANFGEFETHRSNKYGYAVARGNFYPDKGGNIKRGEKNNVKLTVSASVQLNVKFIPPPPYNTSDSLSVTFTNAYYPLSPFKITNNNYSQFSVVILSTGYEYISIDKYKSGTYTNLKDTVFYSAFSTNEYSVYW